MYEEIKRIIKLLLISFLIIIGIRFFIYLLPLFLIIFIVYMVYNKLKKKSDFDTEKKPYNDLKKSKNKKDIILEAEVIKEKIEKE